MKNRPLTNFTIYSRRSYLNITHYLIALYKVSAIDVFQTLILNLVIKDGEVEVVEGSEEAEDEAEAVEEGVVAPLMVDAILQDITINMALVWHQHTVTLNLRPNYILLKPLVISLTNKRRLLMT
jgi:hypothetical protein